MNKSDIVRMNLERFHLLTTSEQYDFIKTVQSDLEITDNLRTDRNRFRSAYYKLLEQLKNLGVEPITTYEKESDNRLKNK